MRTSVLLCSMVAITLAVGHHSGCWDSHTQILIRDGHLRTYRLFAPTSVNRASPAPLVIALHQFTSSGAGMEQLTGFDAIAEREGFVVVYPDGLGRRWNAEPPEKSGAGAAVDDVAFVTAVIDAVGREFVIDRSRVYVAGASNGAMLAYALALRIPERIAAIAAVKCTLGVSLANEDAPNVPMPVIEFHGTDDKVIPYSGGSVTGGPGITIPLLSAEATVQFWASHNGCAEPPVMTDLPDVDPTDGTTVREIAYRNCGKNAEVVFYSIEGGGHTWPGGCEQAPPLLVGKTCRDINASEMIWSFFKRHTRQDLGVAPA